MSGFCKWCLVGVVVGTFGMEMVRAQYVRPDPTLTKSSDALRRVFDGVVAKVNAGTVSVRWQNTKGEWMQAALGTVVSKDGFVLTKASEIAGKEKLQVRVSGKDFDVKVTGVSGVQDLAMLKVDAGEVEWAPVQWADTRKGEVVVGEWVAVASAGGTEPLAVGVMSVGRRRIAGQSGFLGVMMADSDANGGGVSIEQVLPSSAAERAGLKVKDVVTSVNGRRVKGRADLMTTVRNARPGDVEKLTVSRGGKTVELTATLGVYGEQDPDEWNLFNLLSGAVSKRSTDFPAVYQHDSVIRPVDCGGPVVDLDGRVIGIDIARAGRTETYALPADVVVGMLGELESGKLKPRGAK